MGQTYNVHLNVKFNDENGAADALRKKIGNADQDRVDYSLEHYKEIGIGTDTVEDLLKIFFGGWNGKLTKTKSGSLDSGFDACYGWERIMMDAFDDIAPFLANGSSITIYPDSGRDKAVIRDGNAVWIE